MPVEFKLPLIAENVDSADVGKILVNEGDDLTDGQIVMEIETDKAVFELNTAPAGKVAKVHVKSGETVKVGQTLLTIETAGAGAAKPATAPSAPASKGPPPAAAPPASTPPKAAAPPPAKTPPGQSATARPEAEPQKSKAAVAAAPAESTDDAQADEKENGERVPAPAGPATRRLARELGVDLYQVTGSGPHGRITQDDVQGYVRTRLSAPTGGAVAGSLVIPPLPDFSQFGPIEREPRSKLLKTAAANLSLSWQVVPHVTQHELVDVTELEAGRKRFGQRNETSPKVTMTVLAMKAMVTVLKAFPQFNSSYDAAAGEVVLKKYYNIGVAVDTEQGLLVPVIKGVDHKNVMDLAAELSEAAAKARAKKLAIADMQGGTFTITNLGGIGGSFFTPIVNYPEVAILGMSRATQQYVFVDGKPEVRLMLPLSLSYDHRVINGADAARFIVKLAGLLADPFKLLSEV